MARDPLQQYSLLSQIGARQAAQQQEQQQFMINLILKQQADEKEQARWEAEQEYKKLQMKKLEQETDPTRVEQEDLARASDLATKRTDRMAKQEELNQSRGYQDAMGAFGEVNLPPEEVDSGIMGEVGNAPQTPDGVTPLYGEGGTEQRSSKFTDILNSFNQEKSKRTRNLYKYSKELGRDFGAEGAQRILGMGEKGPTELKPNERYHVTSQGQVLDLAGEEGVEVVDVKGLMTKVSPEDKDKVYNTLYTQYSTNLKSGQFDEPLFAQLMKASDDPAMRDIILRQTATYLISNGMEEQAPSIVESYKAKKKQEDLAGVSVNVLSKDNADGTSTAMLIETDKTSNTVRVLKEVTGDPANVPEGSITRGRENLILIDENLKRIDDIDEQLRPSTTGYEAAIKRWGASMASMLNNQAQAPSKDIQDSVVKRALSEQAGLRATRTETGVQRSEAEMARIVKAYGLGEIPYWEAKIQLQILQNNLLFQQKLQQDIVNRKKYEPYVPKKVPSPAYQDNPNKPNKPTKLPPRKPGESLGDYLKRTK